MPLERTPRGVSSSMASARYRIIVPSAAMESLGWRSRVTHVSPTASRAVLLKRCEGASAAIIGKLAYSDSDFPKVAPTLLEALSQLRSAGVKLIADFSDDRTGNPLRGRFDWQIANLADLLVASTPELAEVLRSFSPVPARVITDPVEGKRGEPRESGVSAAAEGPVRLLWFGHWNKVPGLAPGLAQLDRSTSSKRLSLVIVTSPGFGAEQVAQEVDGRWRTTGSACTFRPWSVAAVFDELARCDAVVIPAEPNNRRDAVRSPNRFTESAWAGRFVIAHPLPSYQGLADFGWVGKDLGTGLSEFLADGIEARRRVLAGQDYIARHFTPSVIANAWNEALVSTGIGVRNE
jgi:hypothetical protein